MKLRFQPGLQPAMDRVKGSFLTRGSAGKVIAQKWPKGNGRAKSPFDRMRQMEFAAIAKWASSPFDLDLFTAIEMARGTQYVPRDILMMAAYGRYYTISDMEGNEYMPARDARPDINYMLDSITNAYGSMLFRDSGGWNNIPIGANGQVLTLKNNLPTWVAPSSAPSGGGASLQLSPSGLGTNTDPGATSAQPWIMPKPWTVSKIGTLINGSIGQQYNISLWTLIGNTLDEKIGETGSFTITVNGQQYHELALPAEFEVEPNQIVAATITRLDGSPSTGTPMYASFSNPIGPIKLLSYGGLYAVNKALQSGDTMLSYGGQTAWYWYGSM